jgi:hypothetical protein
MVAGVPVRDNDVSGLHGSSKAGFDDTAEALVVALGAEQPHWLARTIPERRSDLASTRHPPNRLAELPVRCSLEHEGRVPEGLVDPQFRRTRRDGAWIESLRMFWLYVLLACVVVVVLIAVVAMLMALIGPLPEDKLPPS